jgi:hypothetical protein
MPTSQVCLSCEHNPGLHAWQPVALQCPKTRMAPRPAREPFEFLLPSSALVRALRKEGHENHQIRERK